jgi:hypothetical protein
MTALPQTSRQNATAKSSATAVTINAAFFEEIKEAHVEVSAKMDEILRAGRRGSWTESRCSRLTEQLDQLVELVGLYFALEEAYGYFDDPVYVSACYSDRVHQLRDEHRGLFLALSRIRDHAARLLYNGRLADSIDAILSRLCVFCDQLDQHERRERELITEAFSADIGCCD